MVIDISVADNRPKRKESTPAKGERAPVLNFLIASFHVFYLGSEKRRKMSRSSRSDVGSSRDSMCFICIDVSLSF